MLDVLIKGGTLVDGSGAPGWQADVGVKNGRVVAVGTVDESASRTIDADGLVVCPGFVDIHTHLDAQVFWDGTLSPSPQHGVTTVFGGNCGLTLAPYSGQEADADYLTRVLSRVEGIPLESLQASVPWGWSTFGEYLDALQGRLTPNAGFLVGHNALRRAVMGPEATGRSATADEIEAMKTLLRASLGAGGMGFSTTRAASQKDHTGTPVPCRFASPEELIALAGVAGEFPGTTLEIAPPFARFDDDELSLMASMSRAANRPLNWNVLNVTAGNLDMVQHQLQGSDEVARQGGRLVALIVPDAQRFRFNLRSGFMLDMLPGWDRLMTLPPEEKLAMLRDPSSRAEMDRLAQSELVRSGSIVFAEWAAYTLAETYTDEYKRFMGRTIGDIADELGQSAWDTLADIVVADELRTVIATTERGGDKTSWEKRVEVCRDHRTVVGASDAGAHLDMIDSYSYPTTLISKAVREHSLMPVEAAIRCLTAEPAELYGLVDRGVLRDGAWADIVVFDPATVGPEPMITRYDLPGGAGRLYGGANGIHHVLVNGEQVVTDNEFGSERPGVVLRSGLDTTTVTAAPIG